MSIIIIIIVTTSIFYTQENYQSYSKYFNVHSGMAIINCISHFMKESAVFYVYKIFQLIIIPI